MKKRTFITAILAIMMAVTPALAQKENKRSRESHQTRLNGRVVTDEVEDNEFKKFNVRDDFTENGFQWFHNAELLAAGNKEENNAMTISWGDWNTLGRTALTVYVAEKRYTKEFIDKAEYFTVMAFDLKDSKVMNYMGTKSGRDGDKAQTLGLQYGLYRQRYAVLY